MACPVTKGNIDDDGAVRGSVGLGLGVGKTEAGDGERGCFWHSVQPSRKRVTASRGRNAYVSVICKKYKIFYTFKNILQETQKRSSK